MKLKNIPYLSLLLLFVKRKDNPFLSKRGFQMRLAYAQIEELIAVIHGVLPGRRSALEGRLKHFKRLGFPTGVNTGRGKAASYDAAAILKLLIAFELLQLGMMPEKATILVRAMGDILVDAAGYAGSELMRWPDPDLIDPDNPRQSDPFFIILDPMALSPLIAPNYEGELAMGTLNAARFSALIAALEHSGRRTALIDCTHMLGSAAIHLRNAEQIPGDVFGRALLDWADTFEWSGRQ